MACPPPRLALLQDKLSPSGNACRSASKSQSIERSESPAAHRAYGQFWFRHKSWLRHLRFAAAPPPSAARAPSPKTAHETPVLPTQTQSGRYRSFPPSSAANCHSSSASGGRGICFLALSTRTSICAATLAPAKCHDALENANPARRSRVFAHGHLLSPLRGLCPQR